MLQQLKICIAPNAFKGTLSALEAARAIERGLRAGLQAGARARLSKRKIECVLVPMADGGDGTAEAIASATGGRLISTRVSDPLGRPVRARWALSGDGATAVIEMAKASGLALLAPGERNPLNTSTFGTGELVAAAIKRGARKIILGIGGSATNDAGLGLARALGARLLNARGVELSGTGADLAKIESIDLTQLRARLTGIHVEVASDVDNPLYGPRGAAHVYGPQKGASPGVVKQLDDGLRRVSEIWRKQLKQNVARMPGTGAAGGLGGGLVAMLGARLRPGAEIVAEAVGLKNAVRGAALVITGEGRLDAQTAFGKAPAAVAKLARAHKIPVIALCGSLAPDAPKANAAGIDAYFSALETSLDEADLPRAAGPMLERLAQQVGRLLAAAPLNW